MADKKLNDNEIGAFIEAFAESRDSNISPHAQSQTFN
ncbi:hypothetical protein NIG5292_02848 [Nereida ignava]|uniref:Uncharacterized protein n=1 Tax=Nereida ignava TaxID=282199 RepID=A0A0U1NPU1_9RHOB|nr:hypothetical protein NIG5292_02848 [Nereida ignava]